MLGTNSPVFQPNRAVASVLRAEWCHIDRLQGETELGYQSVQERCTYWCGETKVFVRWKECVSIVCHGVADPAAAIFHQKGCERHFFCWSPRCVWVWTWDVLLLLTTDMTDGTECNMGLEFASIHSCNVFNMRLFEILLFYLFMKISIDYTYILFLLFPGNCYISHGKLQLETWGISIELNDSSFDIPSP